MRRISPFVPILLVLAAAGAGRADVVCDEYFEVGSGPTFTSLGRQFDGSDLGQGQTFTLNCGAKLLRFSFGFTWGNPCGDVRALAFGDTLHVAVIDLAGEVQVRDHFVADANLATRTITWYLDSQEVLLPAGTYAAVCWLEAEACAGIRYRTTDLVAGQRITSLTASDLTSWSGTTGELVSTIVADSDVTPAEHLSWSRVKGLYR